MLYLKRKQEAMTLVLIYFGRLPLEHTVKTNLRTFQNVDLEISSIFIFYKRAWV